MVASLRHYGIQEHLVPERWAARLQANCLSNVSDTGLS